MCTLVYFLQAEAQCPVLPETALTCIEGRLSPPFDFGGFLPVWRGGFFERRQQPPSSSRIGKKRGVLHIQDM